MGGGDCFSPASLVNFDDIFPVTPDAMPRIPSYYTVGVGGEGSMAPTGAPAERTPFQDWGWPYQILPYIEEDKIWRLPHVSDEQIRAAVIPIYFCPSFRAPEPGGIDYAGNGGTFAINNPNPPPPPPNGRLLTWHIKEDFPNQQSPGPIYRNGAIVKNRYWPRRPHPAWDKPVYVDTPLRPADFRDGLSTTLLVVENKGGGNFTEGFAGTNAFASAWNMPDSQVAFYYLSAMNHPPPSAHPSSANGLFMDGSVRRLSYKMKGDPRSVPVWTPMLDQTPATAPMIHLSLYQRLCHRFDGSYIEDSQLE